MADEALKLERELNQWPLTLARDEARARLWWELGLAYAEWPRGDRADNLEKAIAAFEAALAVRTREALPPRVGADAGQPPHRLLEPHSRGARR